MMNSRFFCFFFFQAEDGIRDTSVTGVQTCALPISFQWSRSAARRSTRGVSRCERAGRRCATTEKRSARPCWPEIGRASCREREESEVDHVSIEAQNKPYIK